MSKDVKVIVLADSFEQRFFPITQDTPKVLFPLVNELIIEYTLSWLQIYDFKDILVVYKNRNDKIEQHFAKTKRQVQLIHVPDANTVGDALREIYSMQLIHSDFILVHADTICNINLTAALNFYFERQKENKSNIMTSIVRKRTTGSGHLNAEEDYFLYTIDNGMKLLQLDNLNTKFHVRFNNERTKMEKGQCQNVSVHSNLVDCEIYICAYDVLKAFSENLLNNFRDDFMREILTSEITEERFHIYVVPQTETMVRIRTPRLYYQAAQALLQGIFKPFTPNSIYPKTRYNHEDLFKYYGQKVKCHHTAQVSNSSAVGQNTVVSAGVIITNSIIGKNCQIGEQCVIKNSILWDGVIINNNVQINDSILANNVVVGANTVIERGCLLSDKVEIKAGSKVPELTRILIDGLKTDDIYCVKGRLCEDIKNDTSQSMGFSQNFLVNLSQEKDQLGQSLSDESQQPSRLVKQQKKESSFAEEIRILIQECMDDPQAIEQAILAIEIMKLNDNKTLVNCINAFTPEILHGFTLESFSTPQEQLGMMKKKIEIWKVLLQKFVGGQEEESKALINQIEEFCRKEEKFTSCLHLFYQLSYLNDILTKEQILSWAEETEQKDDVISILFMKLNASLITWLKEQDLEEDDEEETEDAEETEDQ